MERKSVARISLLSLRSTDRKVGLAWVLRSRSVDYGE